MKGLIDITIVPRALLLATAALFTCSVPVPAWADDWSNTGAGDWFDNGNWADGTAPTAADDANIDNGGTAQVGTAGAAAADVNLGLTNGGSGFLEITNGGTLNHQLSRIGLAANSTGAVTVTGAGSTWTSSAELVTGWGGVGTVTIANGGTASSPVGSLGFADSATGTVTVTGTGSTWSTFVNLDSVPLFVGRAGDGTLAIENGGVMSNAGSGVIGWLENSTGAVTVSGAGSAWTHGGSLVVGSGGTGTLTIDDGGTVISINVGTIGGDPDSIGTVTVTGAGSSWAIAENSPFTTALNVENGTLTIADGGAVTSDFSRIGGGGTGTVTVSGAGSTLTLSNNIEETLLIGFNGGDGILTIDNGGTVNTSGWANLATGPGTSGTATVSGAGSTWTGAEILTIGGSGTGTLTIDGGGTLGSDTGIIGFAGNGMGTVTVTGAGSTWTNTSTLAVGSQNGDGSLTIADSALVTAGGDLTLGEIDGPQDGASGTLNIGAGGAAGILDTATVNGEAAATLNFNHTNTDYVFSNDGTTGGTAIDITGTTAVNHTGTGTTTLTGANTYTGAT